MFTNETRRRGTFRMTGAALAIAAVGAIWSVAAAQNAGTEQQRPAGSANAQQAEGLSVGTYQPQQAFREYHRTQSFQREVQQLQQQAQNDPQKAIQMQQQLQQKQQQLVQQFQSDVEAAVPEVAKEEDVQLVAAQIVYTSPDLQSNVKDLTPAITEKINEGAAAQQPNRLNPSGLQQQGQSRQQGLQRQGQTGQQQGQQQPQQRRQGLPGQQR